MRYKLNIRVVSLLLAALCLLGCLSSCKKKTVNRVEQSESISESEVRDSIDAPESFSDVDRELTREEIFEKLKPSIVKVICYDFDGKTILSQGTGFFIDTDGTFITNAHVLKNCCYVRVQSYFGSVYDVDVMYKYNDSPSDYAICGIATEYSSIPVEFVEAAKEGDTVYSFGYPNDSYEMYAATGRITCTDAIEGEKHYYTNTALIAHGSSGGALTDSRGRVLGITTGATTDGEYVALKYSDFKDDIKKKYSGGKEPIEYFYTAQKYDFSQATMYRYFDIYVNLISNTDTAVQYDVGVKLKDEYRNAKIVLDTSKEITVTVELETKYDYQEIGATDTTHQVKTTKGTVYLSFSSLDELKKGKEMSLSSSISDSVSEDYFGMDISYEANFWVLQSGTMTVYK